MTETRTVRQILNERATSYGSDAVYLGANSGPGQPLSAEEGAFWQRVYNTVRDELRKVAELPELAEARPLGSYPDDVQAAMIKATGRRAR